MQISTNKPSETPIIDKIRLLKNRFLSEKGVKPTTITINYYEYVHLNAELRPMMRFGDPTGKLINVEQFDGLSVVVVSEDQPLEVS